MLGTVGLPANPFPFPVAPVPLTPQARQALRPQRLLAPWITASWIEEAVERLDLAGLTPLYRQRGSVPFAPLLMLKLVLFCIADGRPSPADWAEMANRDGPCRWLVWGLEPSASACYAFRERLGVEHLLELNRQTRALAQADGLSLANRGAIDGTLQEAAASRHRLMTAQRVEQGLCALEEPLPPVAPLPPSPATPAVAVVRDAQPAAAVAAGGVTQPQGDKEPAANEPEPPRPRRPVRPGRTAAGRARQQRRWQRAREQLRQRQARNQQKRASKRTAPEKVVISPTDPEAALGRDKRGVFRPLYNAQLVADVDSDLILGYEVVAQPNDNGLLPLMLEQSARLLGHPLKLALVDAGYTGGRELAAAERLGITVLGPCAGHSRSDPVSARQLPKSAFHYAAARDVYVCPAGQELTCVGQSRQQRSSVELVVLKQYRAGPGECARCPRQEACCPQSARGRSLSRSEHEESSEQLRARMGQKENRQLYRRRAATVERLFGDGKEQRGLAREAGRGLNQARKQLALTVLQHNLRVLGKAMAEARKKRDALQSDRSSA
jgi:hypothetical protein